MKALIYTIRIWSYCSMQFSIIFSNLPNGFEPCNAFPALFKLLSLTLVPTLSLIAEQ